MNLANLALLALPNNKYSFRDCSTFSQADFFTYIFAVKLPTRVRHFQTLPYNLQLEPQSYDWYYFLP